MKKLISMIIANLGFAVFGIVEGATPSWYTGTGPDKRFTPLSAEEANKLEEADFNQYADALEKHRQEQLNAIKEGAASKEELDAIKDEVNKLHREQYENLQNVVKNLSEEMAQMKMKSKRTGEIKTVVDVLTEKEAELKSFVNKESGSFNFDLSRKAIAKATQVPSDIGDRDDLAERIPGVEQLARRAAFVKNWFRTVNTSTEYIRMTEQDVVVRDAKNVAQCAASTHNTKLTWKQTTLQQKKIRDFVHVCIDMMEDYDFVEGEITDLISYGVQIQVDSQLLLGDGTGANLNGIASYASTFNAALAGADYSAVSGTPIQAPNLGDLICVAGAQIEFLGQDNKFMPNVAFVNPKQLKVLKLTKDANDQYLIPNWLTATAGTDVEQFDNIRLVGNPLVPENEAYVMDSTKGTIYQRKSAEVAMSFENNDNFETETVTVKGIERLNLWVATNNSNAFMHISDIAAGITAITKP